MTTSQRRVSVLVFLALCACTGRIGDASAPEDRSEPSAPSAGSNAPQRSEQSAGSGGAQGSRGLAGAGGTSTRGRAGAGASAAGSGGTSGASTSAEAGRTSAGAGGSDAAGGAGASAPPATSERLYGVTVDSIDALDDTVTSLQMLAKKPTTRLVFDAGGSATRYARAAKQIHGVSGVMGELLDSEQVSDLSVDDYAARTTEYLDALGDAVDIWEIGNEINGEWLGDTSDVVEKITRAYQLVHARGKVTALTLYYNDGCWQSADHEMFRWATEQIPDELKSGLDYVFVSYYDDNCKGSDPNWTAVFTRLSKLFPSSKLGFGECGTKDASKKAEYIQRFYELRVDLPQYVGGYFWWYYRQDMLPYTSQLWSVLNASLQRSP